MKNLNTAFSFAPPSILSLTICLSLILSLSYLKCYSNIFKQIKSTFSQNFYSTEKPRKPYGSGVSYVWTHVPCGTQYIFRYAYSMIVATRPDPTVRPPSRIANVRPWLIAIGWISSIVISMLSPGMHISVPSGRLQTPVTSVVLK